MVHVHVFVMTCHVLSSLRVHYVLLLQALLKQEVLNLDAVEDLLGKRPFTSTTLQNIDRYRWG